MEFLYAVELYTFFIDKALISLDDLCLKETIFTQLALRGV